jgi:hypothetical protein
MSGTEPIRIQTREDLRKVAALLGVRNDWHEPDEQDVTAKVMGRSFDNAGFWPREMYRDLHKRAPGAIEMYVEIVQDGNVVAQVNLATLLAMAAGTVD